jgi:hypothetical protein
MDGVACIVPLCVARSLNFQCNLMSNSVKCAGQAGLKEQAAAPASAGAGPVAHLRLQRHLPRFST